MTTLLPLLSLGSKESCNKGESLPPIPPAPPFFVDVVLTVFKREDQALTLVGETMGLPRPAFHLWVTTSDGVLHLWNGVRMPPLGEVHGGTRPLNLSVFLETLATFAGYCSDAHFFRAIWTVLQKCQ
ncbi:hypothetical protein HJG60_010318 [Phyllostomus discolor]|uniref:Uncharacterized protein n=1 Tax=Phyllostomus discolor TaxID=89673 RepID=A0A834EJV7_9CHIR|nr:hypothetical protein HJG60_010318 [Phyllostomus discolor]